MGVIQRQGIKNAIITYIGIVLGFITLIFVYPNFLTKEEVGLIRLLLFFSSLIAFILPLGIHSVTMKFFPNFRNTEKRHYGYFGFMIIFPLIGFIFFSILLWIFKPLIISAYVVKSKLFIDYFNCVFIYILILGLISVLQAYSASLLKTTVPSFINDIVVRAALIVLPIAYFYKWFDLDHLVYYTIGIYGSQLVLLFVYIFYEDKPSLTIDFKYLRSQDLRGMMKYGIALSFTSIASLGIKLIDTIILGHYESLTVVGLYTVVVFIPTVIEAPLNALEKIAGPKISSAYATDNKTEIKDIYYKSAKYLLLLGGLLFLGVNINIKYLFQLTAHDYAAGINVVTIISLGTLVNMATGVNDSIVFYSKKYIYGTYMLLMLFLLAIVNNIIFIPLFGIEGAALATVLSTLIYNSVKYLVILKTFKMQPFDKKTFVILMLIAICFGINYFIPSFNGHPVLNMLSRSAIICIIYFSGTYFLKIVPEFHQYIPSFKKS